jgi:hypothetical protein
MVIQDESKSITVPFELVGCISHFKQVLDSPEEVGSLKHYCSIQDDEPCNSSSLSD